MTSRPSFTSKRPLSAIFLGSLPSSSHIPDLPEPPSPGAASTGSGLPSPPATNSTGSGSIGDNGSAIASHTRQRPASFSNTDMLNGNYDRPSHTKRTRIFPDNDRDDEDENDEDNTARLDRRRSLGAKNPSENNLALQRVKSLTQRNRMAIDKLASISRLSTPSPSHISHPSRSPQPPVGAASSSSSSSTASSSRHTHSRSEPRHESLHSGSETERESAHLSRTYSSDDLSTTPPLSTSPTRPHSSTGYRRHHRTSSPSSPGRAPSRISQDRGSPGPSRNPRKRVSISTSVTGGNREDVFDHDVTSAALAAVASSRRSPTGNRRSRQPLPKEFRDRDRRSLDGRDGTSITEPSTPRHDRTGHSVRGPPSPRSPGFNANIQQSPRGPRSNRSSTVRDLTRRHQTRWLSEDLSSIASAERLDVDDTVHLHGEASGRKQIARGGSGEYGNGRSLVGEGLRAAGIMRRQDTGDVFLEEQMGSQRRVKSNASGSSVATGDTAEDSGDRQRSRPGGPSARISEGVGPPSSSRPSFDPKTPAPRLSDRSQKSNYQVLSVRPATSMADFHVEHNPPRTAPPALRMHQSAYPLYRDRDKLDGQLRNSQLASRQDRTYASPADSRHMTASVIPLGNGTPNHGRLMLDALSMFESHLSRLPSMGTTTTVTVPELFHAAQNIVHASEKLNVQLRASTQRALEKQIDAEVHEEGGFHGQIDMVELWRNVGADFRENARVSDELVRTTTDLLLGIGKVLKETSTVVEADQQHMRTVSLEDHATTRPTPEVDPDNSRRSDGRRSTLSRRSWEPATREQRETIAKRLAARTDSAVRPTSSLNTRDQDTNPDAEYSVRLPRTAMAEYTPSSSMRRIFTPREQREQQNEKWTGANTSSTSMGPSDSQVLLQNYEPSPTPVSRQIHHSSTLPPLAVPPPLPTLPSESLLRRSSTLDKNGRRKISTTSVVTVRAPNPTFPAISTPNATTAVTPHTVSNSPERTAFPLPRTASGESSRNIVTFSKPSTVSISALNGLQQRDGRNRTISTTSSTNEEASGPPIQVVASPLSGSETERDTRRRTIGTRTRVSLDNIAREWNTGEGSASQAQTIALPSTMTRRERRRTVTEIFSQS